MPKIAISYRRTESDATGRIYDRLEQRYGSESLFRDIDRIPYGVDFRKAVDEELGDADILIAIVGPQWRGINEDGSARIMEENDLVRIEIETALKRDIPLIPVLVSGANMPKATELPDGIRDFSFRNAATIDSGRNFNTDIQRLMRSIDRLLEAKEKTQAEAQREAALKEEAEKERKRAEEEKRQAEARRQADEERERKEVLAAQERAENERRMRELGDEWERQETEARQRWQEERTRKEAELKQQERREKEERERQVREAKEDGRPIGRREPLRIAGITLMAIGLIQIAFLIVGGKYDLYWNLGLDSCAGIPSPCGIALATWRTALLIVLAMLAVAGGGTAVWRFGYSRILMTIFALGIVLSAYLFCYTFWFWTFNPYRRVSYVALGPLMSVTFIGSLFVIAFAFGTGLIFTSRAARRKAV